MTPDARDLTFSQREGLEELPAQLKFGAVSQEFRSLVWYVIYESMQEAKYDAHYGDPWKSLWRDYHAIRLHLPIDEFKHYKPNLDLFAKSIIYDSSYNKLFEFIEFLVNTKNCPASVTTRLSVAFRMSRLAYRLDTKEKLIFPMASEEEAKVFSDVLEKLAAAHHRGGRKHISEAALFLTAGSFTSSVRESILAVESVARIKMGLEKATLGQVLAKIENQGVYIHPALKKGFLSIYGYSSDEAGIRHSLLDQDSKVTERDAIFMLGACSSFITYLLAD